MAESRLTFLVRVAPGSSTAGPAGRAEDGSYRIRLRSRPVENRANAELIALLAGEFGVPRSAVRILTGGRGRAKLVEVTGSTRAPSWFRPVAR
jgi:uncharacterized protein YggU (UPF0235/DUF167 family)